MGSRQSPSPAFKVIAWATIRVLGIHRGLHVVGRSLGVSYGHEVRLRFRMLTQLLQCSFDRSRINADLLLLIGLLHALQILLQCLPLPHTVSAGHGPELGASIATHSPRIKPQERAKRTNSAPAAVIASRCMRRNSAIDL